LEVRCELRFSLGVPSGKQSPVSVRQNGLPAPNGEDKDGTELFAAPVYCRLKTGSNENSQNQKQVAKNSSGCITLHGSTDGNSYELWPVKRMGRWVVVLLQFQPFKACW